MQRKITALLTAMALMPAVARPLAKIGILTDTHVRKNITSCKLARQAFQLFKDKQVDAVVNVGDLSDIAEEQAFKNYRMTFDEVFGQQKPRELYAYAWHDRYHKEEQQGYREFQEQLGAPNGPYATMNLNGIPMLTFPQTGNYKECEAFLQKAVSQNPGKTVFLFAHVPARGTVYNSCIWGAPQMRRMLNKYPNVIHVSGHIHGTLFDERNIWQGEFTEVSAGGLAYWETAVTGWKDPKYRYAQEAMVLEVYEDKAVFRRFVVTTGKEITPEKPWTVPLPFNPETAPYAPERRAKTWPVPAFDSQDTMTVTPQGKPCSAVRVTFPETRNATTYMLSLAAQDKDRKWQVFAEHEVMGFFHDTENKRPAQLQHDFNPGFFTPGHTYQVTVTPQSFFNAGSHALSKTFTMPEAVQWKTVYESKNPMRDCPMYTGAEDGKPMLLKDGFYIHNHWNGRMTFPKGVWTAPKGEKFRLTIRIRTIMPKGTQWDLYLRGTNFGRVYLPQGDSGLKTYVFEAEKRKDAEPEGLCFNEGPFYTKGKLLLDYVKVERLNPGFTMPVQTEPVPKGFQCRDFKDDTPEPTPQTQEKNRGFIIFKRPLTEPIYPTTKPHDFERIEGLKTFGARGQFVNLNFALYPLKELKALFVRDSGGIGNRQLRRVVYWKVKYPQYTTTDGYRTNPEYLFPLDDPFDAPATVPQRFLLTVKLPETTRQEVVRGTLTISCKDAEPVNIPYEIQVMPYALKRDPEKQFSAYNYCIVRSKWHPEAKKHVKDPDWQHKAAMSMFKTMVDYGFTMPPFLYLSRNKAGDAFELTNFDRFYRREMTEAGIKFPFIVAGFDWSCLHLLYQELTGKRLSNHMVGQTPPPEELYDRIEDMLVKFLNHAKKNNYPQIIYGPIDEPSDNSLPMVKRIYEIFRKHGCKTYLTSPGIDMEKKLGHLLDFWSDQPFRDFSEVMAADKKLYFCYPNHNSYEIKSIETMARGGRMTYGFGLWKSGYNVLIPWIWMTSNPDHLKEKGTCGGNRLTPDGSTQVTTYWECFREGIIDGMYVYTLQDAIVKREPTEDPKLKQLLEKGRNTLQKCWNAIPVARKYLGEGHFTDQQFDGQRAELALALREIMKYPETNDRKTPSILADTRQQQTKLDLIAFCREQRKLGNLKERKIPHDEWIRCEEEATLSQPTPGVTRLHILVDHKKDGTEFGGKYPVGWPRMRGIFKGGPLDFNDYDFMVFRMKVNSNRDAQVAIRWPMRMDLAAQNAKSRSMLMFDRVEPGEWKTYVYPIAHLRQQMNLSVNDMKKVAWVQYWIGESQYSHGDDLTFDFASIALVGLKKPTLWKTEAADAVKVSDKIIRWKLHTVGQIPQNLTVQYSLVADDGKTVKTDETMVTGSETEGALTCENVPAGNYTLQFTLKGQPNTVLKKNIAVLPL